VKIEGEVSLRRSKKSAPAHKPTRGPRRTVGVFDLIKIPKRACRLYTFEQAQLKIDELARLPRVREEQIGLSTEGRPLRALSIGSGPIHLVAIAGAHGDEPIGPASCLALVEALATQPSLAPLLERIRLSVVPLANPDGTARNQFWFPSWQKSPDLETYLRHVRRDPPGRAVEFGFRIESPELMKPESRAIAAWFSRLGPIDHYVSLHSMFLNGGALFLAMGEHLEDSAALRLLTDRARALGMPLHDKDRCGQKGFYRIGPGLHSAPTAEAMAKFFDGGGEKESADAFTMNSMEYTRRMNGCPLALVTELPMIFDPAFSSQEKVESSRVDQERAHATELHRLAEEVLAFIDEVPDKGELLKGPTTSAKTTASLASGLLGDLDRYRGRPGTLGVGLENELDRLRRRASLYGALSTAFDKANEPAWARYREQAALRATDALGEIRRRFRMKSMAIETHMNLQMAAILLGYAARIPTSPGLTPSSSSL
jgi:hypothetical protein